MKHENAEEAILAQARVELDCWAAGDVLGYTQSATDDVTYFDHYGGQALVDGIQALRDYVLGFEKDFPVHTYEIVDPKVQVYGDVGILTLHDYPTSLDGEAMGPAKGTCVYRWTEGGWHLVHVHWSRLELA